MNPDVSVVEGFGEHIPGENQAVHMLKVELEGSDACSGVLVDQVDAYGFEIES
jgi:hypothetical protein